MFEIIHIKTFQGDEFKLVGNKQEIEFLWKEKNNDWDILYFKKLEDDGVELCLKKLMGELNNSIFEKTNGFLSQAFDGCEKA